MEYGASKYVITDLWILLPKPQGLSRPKYLLPCSQAPFVCLRFFIATLPKGSRAQRPVLLPLSPLPNIACPTHVTWMHLSASLRPQYFPLPYLFHLFQPAPFTQHELPVSLCILHSSPQPLATVDLHTGTEPCRIPARI